MKKPILREENKKQIIIISILMVVLLFSCLFTNKINAEIKRTLKDNFSIVTNHNNLIVHFIDVGQADATAINLPDGKVMLIDSGTKYSNVDYSKYLKENVVNTRRNVEIDYLVLTHADADHVGGTMKILKNFQINTVFMPKIHSDSQTFQEILNNIVENYNYHELGEEFYIKSDLYEFKFFKLLNTTNTNDSSQVIRLDYKNNSFLFTGDISTSIEDDYVEKYAPELDSDVLKVSHHGSKSSSSEEFLRAVSPKYSVISTGDNDYGHPNEEVLNRLNDVNSKILRTDIDGNIVFVSGDGYNFDYLTGNYKITGLYLNYPIFVIIVEFVLSVLAMVVVWDRNKIKRYRPRKIQKKLKNN